MKKSHTFWGMFLILWFFWIALTASFNWQALLIGGLASFFVVRFNSDEIITEKERPVFNLKNLWNLTLFFSKFITAVFIANFQVAILVLSPRLPIKPEMVSFKVDLKKEVSRVLLANAITLTPGTLTILSNNEEMLIHALTAKNAAEVKEWELINDLKKMEE